MYLKGEDRGTGNVSSNKRSQIILQCLGLLLKFIAMISLDGICLIVLQRWRVGNSNNKLSAIIFEALKPKARLQLGGISPESYQDPVCGDYIQYVNVHNSGIGNLSKHAKNRFFF